MQHTELMPTIHKHNSTDVVLVKCRHQLNAFRNTIQVFLHPHEHIRKKDEAKNDDKTMSADNVMVPTMDLQQVQFLPKVDVGPAYYLR